VGLARLCLHMWTDITKRLYVFRLINSTMATIDGRPAQYGIALKQLRELMEYRGEEGIIKINNLGGVQDICRKLYTSPNEGQCTFTSLRFYDRL